MKRAIIALSMTVMSVNAGLVCGYKDYHVFSRGFSQGFQANKQATNTDCFNEVGAVMQRIDSTIVSVTPQYYSAADWMRPVYKSQEVMLEWTRMMSACQSTSFAKQLETRVSTWSGIMDLISNAVASVAKWYVNTNGTGVYPAAFYTDPTQAQLRSPLMDSFFDMLYSNTCARQSRAAGIVLAEILNVQSPDAVYYKDLALDLGK